MPFPERERLVDQGAGQIPAPGVPRISWILAVPVAPLGDQIVTLLVAAFADREDVAGLADARLWPFSI